MNLLFRSILAFVAFAFVASGIGHGWVEARHDVGHASGWAAVPMDDHGIGSAQTAPHVHVVHDTADRDAEGQGQTEMPIGHQHQIADGHVGLPMTFEARSELRGVRHRLAWTAEPIPATLQGDGPEMPPRPTRI